MIARLRRISSATRILAGVVVAGTLWGSGVGWGEASPEVWYARKLTLGETPLRVEHFWSKGRKLRAHTVLAGHPIVTIVNGERYYVLDLLARSGVAIRRSPKALEQDRAGGRPFGLEGDRLRAEGAENVRSERLAGALCDVYRLTDAQGRREVWVTQESPQLPLRVEIFDRRSGRTARNDFIDWTQSVSPPDSFFEPDPSIALERIEYPEFVRRSAEGPVGPAPVLYSDLLHGW